MKRFAIFALLGILSAPPGAAYANALCEGVAAAESNIELNKYFTELKRERDERAAERIADMIWNEWFKSGSSTVDLLMTWAQDAIRAEKYEVALDLLDQIIVLRPAYAEGWNRRATLHFLMNRYDKSMADIACTLVLEPRHFGAWSGMGMIYKNSGLKEKALEAYLKVLEYYPAQRNAQREVDEIIEELAEEGI